MLATRRNAPDTDSAECPAVLLLGILALVAIAIVVAYNGLVRLRLQAVNAWSDVDVQLKRRHDLVPNLVETVKGYAGHERRTLDAVVTARARAMATVGPAERGQAETALGTALRSLFVVAEGYPELRAAASFGQLHRSLVQVEDAIQNARRYYNAVVRDLNTRIEQFPTNLVARAFGFRPREFFALEAPEERAAPAVHLQSA
jgi:LemA protein